MPTRHHALLAAFALLAAPAALAAQSNGATLATRTAVPTRTDAPALPAPAADDTTARYRLTIPAQPLRDALADFARQTGFWVQVATPVEGAVQAPAVHGTLTVAEALRALLAGSGYVARIRDAETVVVGRADPVVQAGAAARRDTVQALAAVVVTAESNRRSTYGPRRSTTATKTDLPLRDVPQSVTVLGRALMADVAMQGMADLVRYVPGVTMGQGEGHRDAPTIRGNSSTADFFVDGVRDDVQYLRDLYNVERVEALKGSNAMVFGRGGGGGVINRVTKEAQWAPTRGFTLEGGSWGHRRLALDLGQGFGRGVALRFNGMREDSDLFRDRVTRARTGLNPTAAILLGNTLVRAGYEFFRDDRTVDRGIPSAQGRPSGLAIDTYVGDPKASPSWVTVHAGHTTVERGFGEAVKLRNRTSLAYYDKFYQNVYPGGALSADGTRLNLAAYNSATDRHNLFNQTDLTLTAATGAVKHTLLVGAEVGRQVSDNFRATGYFNGTATSYGVDAAAPTVTAPVTFRQSATDAFNRTTARVASAYAQEQLTVGPLQAIAGLRFDRFDLDYVNKRDGATLDRRDDLVSPRVGLVLKPVEPLSVYASYGVSHLPASGDQFGALTASSATLEPERFDSREVGVKWEPRRDLAVTGALYRLDRSNTTAPNPADPRFLLQTGRQRTTGGELGVTGHLTNAWQVAGGWAVQKATIVERTTAAAPGATVPLVPHHTLTLWNRYQFTRLVGAGVGVIHQADMYAAIDNAVTLPAFTRYDAAVFVALPRALRAQVNVENLLNERYYATSHGNNNIMPGAPRTVRVALTLIP